MLFYFKDKKIPPPLPPPSRAVVKEELVKKPVGFQLILSN
jgi:hypothetical protein